ncbi:MFS transporter [Sphingopyxis panaciterrulae]|uniref:Putative MFS family arabinose efflux permease n=1 Tax=Sphingopyxis panaciterrulae TaxID=462372 RepID=A0A7W9B9C3_9SPHN|nr:MFS transporter [Sphingopyxis panaciterrulae]MBB5708640.1 putative MFS family arabinose efflux permease [Sphingopyxis panaciterrulae]
MTDVARTPATDAAMDARIGLLAVAGGFVAANGHFNQPLLPAIARSFGEPAAVMGALPAITQFGLAIGLFTVVPLYDLFERRRMIVATLLLLAAAAAAHSLATDLPLLWATAFLIGLGCCSAQLMTPYAALLAPPGREGRASSLVLSGILTGVLLSRVVAGFVEQTIGWRYLYGGSAVCTALVALAVARVGTPSRNPDASSYPMLMRSMKAMIAAMPQLRRHALNGAMTFGALMLFWGTYAGHVQQSFGFGPLETGLIGLVGVAGAAGASFAGRWVDGGRFRQIQIAAAVLMLAGYGCLWLGAATLPLFCIGVLLIDVAGGLSHAGNQSSAFRIDPAARGRINSIYMVAYFLGGAVSVSVATLAYLIGGWPAICALGIAMALGLLGLEFLKPVAALRRMETNG